MPLYIVPFEFRADISYIASFIVKYNITRLVATPSFLNILFEDNNISNNILLYI